MAIPYSSTSQDTMPDLRDTARHVMAKAEEAAKAAGREASKAVQHPDKYLQNLEIEASSYIRSNPARVVVIAAAFGFIFGALRSR